MASYEELRGQFSNDSLRNKVSIATVISAYNLLQTTPTLQQKKFAETVASSPDAMGEVVLMYVLAANKNLTVAQIEGATDAQIQTAADAIVPNIVDALFGV